VNEVIRQMAAKYPNIMVVDWATTTADNPNYTGGDHLHLTTEGRKALAANVALALGDAPVTPGACLSTSFTNDSMGPVTGTSVPYRPVHTTVASGTPAPVTTTPSTSPTVSATQPPSPTVTTPAPVTTVGTTTPKTTTPKTTTPKTTTPTTPPKPTTPPTA
jgi:hypothetical protein